MAAAALAAAATAIAVPPHHHHHHDCIHDTLRKRTVVSPQRPSRRRLDTAALPGLRVVFNTETMVDDGRACTAAGQSVELGDPPSPSTTCAGDEVSSDCWHTCSTSDVLTAARRAILTDVLLPAVSAWFAAALRIRRPVQGPLAVKDEACGFGGDVSLPGALLKVCVTPNPNPNPNPSPNPDPDQVPANETDAEKEEEEKGAGDEKGEAKDEAAAAAEELAKAADAEGNATAANATANGSNATKMTRVKVQAYPSPEP